MSLGGLESALSGLRIAQQHLDVIANNVANVSTPGYSRKILPQATLAADGKTIGVRGMPVMRNVDMNLSRDLWTQVSATALYDVQSTYLDRIQQFHGPAEAEISVAAQIAELRDKFSALADSPEDAFLQRSVVNQATIAAGKINQFAGLLTEMRNDAQAELAVATQQINDLLNTIAETNKQIKYNTAIHKTNAALQDERDKAINELAQLMDISFFTRGDGVLVVQTKQGVQLADERPEQVFFQSTVLGPTSYYPADANGLFVGGNPATNPNAIEITATGVGGKMGGLLELRDDILPRQQAQLDEVAHKLALRMDSQGLRLFTDPNGQIPANTDPVPDPPGPLTPVPYVGFSSVIQVNPAIIADNSLVQKGTVPTDIPVLSGSNEVVRRVMQFGFGATQYQQATGTVDLRAAATGGTTLQDWLGLRSENTVTGQHDITTYSDLNALMTAGGTNFTPPPPAAPLNAQFALTFEEPRTGLGPVTITIDLATAMTNQPIGGPIQNAADQISAEINAQIAAAALPAGMAASARINQYGQLVIDSTASITVDNGFVGGMNTEALGILGLTAGTSVTRDPYIEIQVGNDTPVRITIEPGDTEAELMDKLEYNGIGNPGVPGLYAFLDPATGALTLRPGGDDTGGGPHFGGDIKITGGPFIADGTGTGGTAAGTNIITALFGVPSPVIDIPHENFRDRNLGAGANLSTGIISSTDIIDFGQKMVNRQTEEYNLTTARQSDSQTFHDLLSQRQMNDSGVNLDEELSNLIVMQTAFSAAARVVTSIDEMFRELLNAV